MTKVHMQHAWAWWAGPEKTCCTCSISVADCQPPKLRLLAVSFFQKLQLCACMLYMPYLQVRCTLEDKAAATNAKVAHAVYDAMLAAATAHKAQEQVTEMLFACARRCEHGPDVVAACARFAADQNKTILVRLLAVKLLVHSTPVQCT